MFSTYAVLPNCNIRAMEGILSSLGKRNIPVIALSPVDCVAFKSKYVSRKIFSPDPANEEKFLTFLIEKVPKGILFPADDHTTLLFSKHAKALRESGFIFNINDFSSLNSGFDKWLCYLEALKINIPCAFTKQISLEDDVEKVCKDMPFPFIFKATTLAGGNYVKVTSDSADIKAAYSEMLSIVDKHKCGVISPEIIVQEWLEYDMADIWCVESYYDQYGRAQGFLPIRKERTVIKKDGTYGSRLYAGEVVENSTLVDLSRKLLDHLGWKGFAHFDWVYSKKKDSYYLTEINPRLPGFSFYPSRAGFEMAYYYYADLSNTPYTVEEATSSLYYEIFRYPGDISSSISTIIRKQYSLRKFIESYLRIFKEDRKVFIDFFDPEDPKMTWFNFLHIIKTLYGELKNFIYK